ncbi:MAG: hypothetical protein IJ716_08400 [Lachnospiraceae bacterium]|nr:hypothetical protein [Lachnospiraceae bacterium]
MRTTNIRFQEKREEDDRAWDILHKLEELNCKSQSALVVRALNAYYDQHLKKQADPYFETREKEDAFADRIVDVIEKKVFSMLPTMVGMAFMQQMAGMNGGAGNQVHGEGTDGDVSGQMMEDGMSGSGFGRMAGFSNISVNAATQASGVASSVNQTERYQKGDSGQQTKQLEVVTEDDDVEENEFLDTDLF